jgi:alkaline phosphatase
MRLFLFAAVSLLLAGCATPPTPTIATSAPSTERAKNVIFLVGAGMGINTLTAARIYSVGEEGDLTIDTLPESAFVKTYSNNAQATDSAAAMAAYMTGVKANNGGSSPCVPGQPTLAALARAQGRAVGLVTTSSVTAAGPAAVYAQGCSRALAGMDVVLGGGPVAVATPRIVTDTAQLAAQTETPFTGLFAPGAMDFDADRDPARQPSLAEMTGSAIKLLSRRSDGFLLVVEGGGIDRALRSSHAKRALQETVAFDAALKTAITQMQRIDPGLKNTLIVATADHDNSLLINGYSPRTGKTTATNAGVLGVVRNVGDNKVRLDKDGMPYAIVGFGNGEHRVNGSRATAPALTDAITSADDYRQEATIRIAPGAGTSSGNDVYLGAIGAGAETFQGTIDNTRVFSLIKAAAGW